MSLKQLSKTRAYTGWLYKYTHNSTTTKTPMNFNIYLPDTTTTTSSPSPSTTTTKLPALYYLSGLTCTEDNFAQKATVALQYACEQQIALVCPDTSPRNDTIQQHSDGYDFGVAASFYINATQSPWSQYYRMYDYILTELPQVIEKEIKEVDGARKSIFGHSMGGHGALMLYLRNPGTYRSVSAFAPICHPTQCQWGQKAFKGYLGEDAKDKPDGWAMYDSTMLVKAYNGPKADILIDQGTDDKFYKEGQLLPERFVEAASGNHTYVNVNVRYQEHYDHSYYFISTFVKDHILHHAKYLNAKL